MSDPNLFGTGLKAVPNNFLEAQGYKVHDSPKVYQDNQSAILLEKNGKASSSKMTGTSIYGILCHGSCWGKTSKY